MTVWYTPAPTAGFGLCVFVDIEIRVFIDLADEFEYILEQFFLGFGLFAGLLCTLGDFQMFVIQMEGHCAQYDIHALL